MTDLNALAPADAFAHLTSGPRAGLLERLMELAALEDLGPDLERGDVTGQAFVPGYVRGAARLVLRQAGTLCGLACTHAVLHAFRADCDLVQRASDGDTLPAGTVVAELEGELRSVLRVERTLLNLVGRLSGIATRTAGFVAAAGQAAAGAGVKPPAVLDTRKTTPGLRILEKYAVRCGGGHCHRLGLYDAVLIKDNHLSGVAKAGGRDLVAEVGRAVRLAVDEAGRDGLAFIEVEVDRLEQLRELLAAGAPLIGPAGVGMVLLDNMPPEMLPQAVAMRNAAIADGRIRTLMLEASGGVNLQTIGGMAATGVDRISVGSLTHGAVSLDVGLDIDA
jgi:nicotinate-nucleotide pyrophosphorylase (carboxylating)